LLKSCERGEGSGAAFPANAAAQGSQQIRSAVPHKNFLAFITFSPVFSLLYNRIFAVRTPVKIISRAIDILQSQHNRHATLEFGTT
jgi:hypothetical protein